MKTVKKIREDALHIPYTKLVVKYKGKEVILLNKAFIDQQNCWENLEELKKVYVCKLEVYDLIRETQNSKKLKKLTGELTEIDFKLQELFKFPRDANYHRIWEYPKCGCPVMDNKDRYPYGHIIDAGCPLHGSGK